VLPNRATATTREVEVMKQVSEGACAQLLSSRAGGDGTSVFSTAFRLRR
jgi:hypothetical protein